MPTPSNTNNNLDFEENNDMSIQIMKSVAIEVPREDNHADYDGPGTSHAELLAEIRRLSLRLEAVEAQLSRESSEDEAYQGVDYTKAVEVEPTVDSRRMSGRSSLDSTPTRDKEMNGVDGSFVRKPNNKKKEKTTPVRFEASAWNIPLVIGLADVGWMDTCSAAFIVLVNLGMQTAFSGILLSEPFMGESFDSNVESARIWRRSVAHDDAYIDLSGTSLVSRVCAMDGALILSNEQAALVKQINAFLGINKADPLTPQLFQPGVLLCILCILLWTLCVYKEIRGVWLSLEATMQIPRARGTSFQNYAFSQISYGRYCLLLWTYAARAAIAGWLLVAGVLWLARTTSITELMLNAVALNAILDVDEFLFSCLTPIKIQHVIQTLDPIQVKYSRRRSQCETVAHFTFISAVVLLAYFLLVGPLTDTMLEVKRELCGGNQSFVVTYNRDTQLTYGLVTNKAAARNDGQLSTSELAVKRHIDIRGEMTPGEVSDYILFAPSRRSFEEDRTRSMSGEASNWPFCIETKLLTEGALLNGDANLQPAAEVMLRNAGLALGYDLVSDCAQLSHMCDRPNAGLLRLVCGETCGCTDAVSSPFYKVPAQGCSQACLQDAEEKLANLTCENNETGRNWDTFWNTYETALTGYYGEEVTQTSLWYMVNATVQGMLSHGCGYLEVEPQDFVTGVNWCEGMPDLFKPLAQICPQTCGCDGFAAEELPSYCPPRCGA